MASLNLRDCRTGGLRGPAWILSMLECSFEIFYTTCIMAHGPHEEIKKNQTKIDEQIITEVLTVNGVRFSFEDGSWGLIRASSNKHLL